MEEAKKMTMTVDETVARMRASGIRISPAVIREGLKQKTFPFGDAIESEKSFRFLIYTRLFEQWMAERAV